MSLPTGERQQQGESQPSSSEREKSQDPQTQLPGDLTSSQRNFGGFTPGPDQSSMGIPSDQFKASSPPYLRSEGQATPHPGPGTMDTAANASGRFLSPQYPSDDETDPVALKDARGMMPIVLQHLWNFRTYGDKEDKWFKPTAEMLDKLCKGLGWTEVEDRAASLLGMLVEQKRQAEKDAAADGSMDEEQKLLKK